MKWYKIVVKKWVNDRAVEAVYDRAIIPISTKNHIYIASAPSTTAIGEFFADSVERVHRNTVVSIQEKP